MRPTVSEAAEELYAALGSQARGDDEASGGSWLLLHLCHALTLPLQEIQDLAADVVDEDGRVVRPGWSVLLDVDEVPSRYLGFVAQLVGVRLAPGLDEESQRVRVRSAAGWGRGTPAAIEAAARQWLTGDRQVTLTERHLGSAYRVRVRVYEAEAIDPDQLGRAIRAAIPAGIIPTIEVIAGWTIAEMEAELDPATIADVETDPTWASVREFERQLPAAP